MFFLLATVLLSVQFTNALLRLVKENLVYGSHVLPLLLVLVLPMWNLVLPLALVRLKLVQHVDAEAQEAVDVRKDKNE
ncbi:hypothetical protein Y032_0053g2362 [Ancylostoma ceylanicum]|uniref:Uncharacterized protein n=1 Tax=Ancylostoma ceylanicum TaxID=53326 RepID=A0A016U7S2_9BILA|nr:hypothetical protein Y032_0053g2362 [Ancylostoma ceylanicum]